MKHEMNDVGLSKKRSKLQLSKSFTVLIPPLSTRLIKPNFNNDFDSKMKTENALLF